MSEAIYNRPAGGRRVKPYAGGAGGQTRTPVEDANYQIKAWDKIIVLEQFLSANRTLTLPAANSVPPGHTIWIIDRIGTLEVGFFHLRVAPLGSDTIGGGAAITVDTHQVMMPLVSNGANEWYCDLQKLGIFRDLFCEHLTCGKIDSFGIITQASNEGPLGYATGAGGTVVQVTSKSTAVTLGRPCGAITTHNAALAGFASISFTVNNSTVSTGDVVVLASRNPNYRVEVADIANGSFVIRLTNLAAGSLSHAVVINFAVLNVATS